VASLRERLGLAVDQRAPWIEEPHTTAWRAFNGFLEGWPALVVDVYATSVVLFDYAGAGTGDRAAVDEAIDVLRARLPWLRIGYWKIRSSRETHARAGTILFGADLPPDEWIVENGARYAFRPLLHQDAGLYLDTRELRRWLRAEMQDARVLNAFAYTGSLGLAARVAPAASVTNLDRNARFLRVARESYRLNGLQTPPNEFVCEDVLTATARWRRTERLFDCVIVDPPHVSSTAAGRIDVVGATRRLIDKCKPLVADGGRLVVVNNALYVSGRALMDTLDGVCADGFAAVEQRIDVPMDCTGALATRVGSLPADPAPFNHATKIAVLRIRRRDRRRE